MQIPSKVACVRLLRSSTALRAVTANHDTLDLADFSSLVTQLERLSSELDAYTGTILPSDMTQAAWQLMDVIADRATVIGGSFERDVAAITDGIFSFFFAYGFQVPTSSGVSFG
jgi:hypothetical protein